MNTYIWRTGLIALSVGSLVAGTGVAQAAAQCTGAAEARNITMMADWLPWASQGPMVTAQLNGYYDEEGIEVEIIAPANPADPIKLVARERVTFSLTYVPEVMLSRETGIPVIAVATTLRVLSSGLFFKADGPISGPADLAGLTLGVGPKLDAQAFLATLLEAGGLTRDDVQVVDPGYAHVPMILTDRIDAAHGLTYSEGMVTEEEMVKEGDSGGVGWLLYRDYGVPAFYYQVIVANEDWVQENPNATCRFLRATLRGLDDWLADATEANAEIARSNEQFTADQHTKIYDGTRTHWTTAEGEAFVQDVAVWEAAQDWAVARNLITVPADPASYFTNDYLPEN